MTGFWRTLLHTIARNPISFFAVLCVAATAALLARMAYRMIAVLESSDWCGRAIQAERIKGEGFSGLTGCVELFTIQLNAVATGFHITLGGFVFSLIVLVVVVVAGARASFKLGSSGLEGDVSRQDAAHAADQVAGAAVEEADAIKDGRS